MSAQPDTIIIISHGPNVAPEVQLPDSMSTSDAATLLRQAANNLELDGD
jgi:hypothetical protein